MSNDIDAVAGLSQDKFAQMVAGASILIFIGSGVLASYRGTERLAAKHALDWALFFLLLVAVYTLSFRTPDLRRPGRQ